MSLTEGQQPGSGGPLLSGYSGLAAVLRHRDFRVLLGASFFQSLAFWIEQVALGWLVLSLTNSPFMVGAAYAARMLPFFFLGIPAGAVADRLNRRLLMQATTAGVGATFFIIAGLAVSGAVEAWHLLLLAFGAGCMRAFFATAFQTYIYDVVGPRHAVTGMAAMSIVSHLSGIIGAIAAGRITAAVGSGVSYLVMGVAFAASLALLLAMRGPDQVSPRNRESTWRTIQGAFRVLRTNRILMTLMGVTAASEVFGYSYSTLLPVLARDVLHVGADGLGLMTAVRAGAGIVGPLVLAFLGEQRGQGKLLLGSTLLFGVGIVSLAYVPNLLLALGILAALNAAGSAVDVLVKTMMQVHVSNEERGRAMGAWVAGIGFGPAGQAGAGGIASALGPTLALTFNGGMMVMISIAVFVAVPRLRRL